PGLALLPAVSPISGSIRSQSELRDGDRQLGRVQRLHTAARVFVQTFHFLAARYVSVFRPVDPAELRASVALRLQAAQAILRGSMAVVDRQCILCDRARLHCPAGGPFRPLWPMAGARRALPLLRSPIFAFVARHAIERQCARSFLSSSDGRLHLGSGSVAAALAA